MKKQISIFAGLIFAVAMIAGMTGCTNNEIFHTHTPSDEWNWNDTHHWHEASCGDTNKKFSKAEHVFGEWEAYDEYEKKQTCSVCGYSHFRNFDDNNSGPEDTPAPDTSNTEEKGYGELYISVSEFLEVLGSEVTTITAYDDQPGITKSDDGKTVNVYGVRIYGKFDYSEGLSFPTSIVSADLTGLKVSDISHMTGMFYQCSNLTSLNVSNFDTESVTDMSYMFCSCSQLTDLNLSSFDTSKVTDMSSMFCFCPNLTTLDLSSFNTSKVTNMYFMFQNCMSLKSLNIRNFDTSSVSTMSGMFHTCEVLSNLDLSSFNTSNVTSMGYMFYCCTNLTTLDLSSFDTSNVSDTNLMFADCSSLTTIYASSGFTTNKITYDTNMFMNCPALTGGNGTKYDSSITDATYARIDGGTSNPGYFTVSKCAESGHSYNETFVCTECGFAKTDLTVEEFFKALGTGVTTITADPSKTGITRITSDTVNVYGVKISGEFDSSHKFPNTLTSADLTGLDTYGVTSMSTMFSNCKNLETLDLGKFDTSRVTSMNQMFYTCENLKSLNVSRFNTSNVTDMSNMFSGCKNLTSLDISSFDTSMVTDMSNMFYDCESLTTLDVTKFNTSEVTNIGNMFTNCANLTELDLRSFNTLKVTEMAGLFKSCTNLTTIYVSSNFSTAAVTTSYSMFDYCDSLTGGNGTQFDSSITDKTYARIDTAETPGYFSE